MASNREKLKEMMASSRNIAQESTRTTVIDDLVEEYDRVESAKEAGLLPEAPKEPKAPRAPKVKKTVGRPRKFKEDVKTVFVNVQLLDSEVKFLQKYGGEFGGKTGYIRKLVQEEMSRVLEK